LILIYRATKASPSFDWSSHLPIFFARLQKLLYLPNQKRYAPFCASAWPSRYSMFLFKSDATRANIKATKLIALLMSRSDSTTPASTTKYAVKLAIVKNTGAPPSPLPPPPLAGVLLSRNFRMGNPSLPPPPFPASPPVFLALFNEAAEAEEVSVSEICERTYHLLASSMPCFHPSNSGEWVDRLAVLMAGFVTAIASRKGKVPTDRPTDLLCAGRTTVQTLFGLICDFC
jgi:hypothetical protein